MCYFVKPQRNQPSAYFELRSAGKGEEKPTLTQKRRPWSSLWGTVSQWRKGLPGRQMLFEESHYQMVKRRQPLSTLHSFIWNIVLKKMLKGGSKGDPARISGTQKSTMRRAQPAVWLSCSLWRRQRNLFWHLAVKFTLDETGSVVIPPYIRCQGHWETQALTWLRPKLENP